jgi:exosome complex component RRP41
LPSQRINSVVAQSRYELLSPEGLRVDGRRWNEIRRFHAQLSTQPAAADGSSYVEQGNTKVICTVTGPAEPSMRSRQVHDRATVSVEVTFAAFSGNERKKRGKGDKCVFSLFFFYPPIPFLKRGLDS